MEIKQGHNKFFIGEKEEAALGFMSYVPSGEKIIIIDSTHVSEELKGQGAGKKMLYAIVGWARENDKKIIPLCPYAKAQMEKDETLHDLIHR